MKIMKTVRISDCESSHYWYTGFVGELFKVEDSICDDFYEIVEGQYKGFWLHKNDCTVMLDIKLNVPSNDIEFWMDDEALDYIRKHIFSSVPRTSKIFSEATTMTDRENEKYLALKKAGMELAEASHRIVAEYDGVHRLADALANWYKVVGSK